VAAAAGVGSGGRLARPGMAVATRPGPRTCARVAAGRPRGAAVRGPPDRQDGTRTVGCMDGQADVRTEERCRRVRSTGNPGSESASPPLNSDGSPTPPPSPAPASTPALSPNTPRRSVRGARPLPRTHSQGPPLPLPCRDHPTDRPPTHLSPPAPLCFVEVLRPPPRKDGPPPAPPLPRRCRAGWRDGAGGITPMYRPRLPGWPAPLVGCASPLTHPPLRQLKSRRWRLFAPWRLSVPAQPDGLCPLSRYSSTDS